jgi:hypothetical protein
MPSDGNVSANYHDPNRLLLMDRVLGKSFSADQPNHKGLYYQWGRKDPFYHTESNQDAYRPDNFDYTETVLASNLTNAILYPTTFFRGAASSYDWLTSPQDGLWNPTMGSQTKSYYDPCPEGWRVPPSYYTDIDFSPWLHEGGYVAERNSTGFIPSAMGEADLQSATYLWTSSVNGAHAVYVGGSSSGGYTHSKRMYRAAALSVRCVKDLARQY